MKKLLSILGVIGLTATTTLSVVACNSKKEDENGPWVPDAAVEGIAKISNQRLTTNSIKKISIVSTNGAPFRNGAKIVSSHPEIAEAGINETNKSEITLRGNQVLGTTKIIVSYPGVRNVEFDVEVVAQTTPYIEPIQDVTIIKGKEANKTVAVSVANKTSGTNIAVKTEAPQYGQNEYPQKEPVTTAKVVGDQIVFTLKNNSVGQDNVTVSYGSAKPIKFKVSVYEESYIENPPGKDKSAFATWGEANPNRTSKNVKKENWNGKTYFAPYIDAALYAGDNMKEILAQNMNLDHITLAFAAQDGSQTDKLDISFAGVAKKDPIPEGPYWWYLNKKLVPDILKPIADAGVFKNTKISYGGYNAGAEPEKYLPWVLANKLNPKNAQKAQKDLENAFVNFQKETAALVNQPMSKSIDFDIEGEAQLDIYNKDTRLLAKTLAGMVKKDHDWDFSLTVAVLPTGLVSGPNKGQQVLDSFIEEYKNAQVPLEFLPKVNPMVMDYGNAIYDEAIANGKTNADLAIMAMESTKDQLKASILKYYQEQITDEQAYSLMGSTPMIGVNDTEHGIFTLEDAKELYSWAQVNNLSYLSMWSMNDDRGLSYPIIKDPSNQNQGFLGGQQANKSQTSHGLLYLNEYDFTKVLTGDWKYV